MEPPIAISKANALSIASIVTISRGLISFSIRTINCFAQSLTNCLRSSATARIVPLPGIANPRPSAKQFMEFAVNIPEHDPQVGQPYCSSSSRPASSNLPAWNAPTPSNTEEREMDLPFLSLPAFIGPPLTNIVGMLTRRAPMIIPGVILSQLGIQIMPSNQCALTTVSKESAIISRLGKE
ncbi:hypothetical protein D3C84_830780 [compost metagenome]